MIASPGSSERRLTVIATVVAGACVAARIGISLFGPDSWLNVLAVIPITVWLVPPGVFFARRGLRTPLLLIQFAATLIDVMWTFWLFALSPTVLTAGIAAVTSGMLASLAYVLSLGGDVVLRGLTGVPSGDDAGGEGPVIRAAWVGYTIAVWLTLGGWSASREARDAGFWTAPVMYPLAAIGVAALLHLTALSMKQGRRRTALLSAGILLAVLAAVTYMAAGLAAAPVVIY
jgi:hypothetical protein